MDCITFNLCCCNYCSACFCKWRGETVRENIIGELMYIGCRLAFMVDNIFKHAVYGGSKLIGYSMKDDKFKLLREKFKDGDWVFGVGEHIGCSMVFDSDKENIQPFSYLGATNPDDFRLATDDEIEAAKFKSND